MKYFEVYTVCAALIVAAKNKQDALAWANEKLEEEGYPIATIDYVYELEEGGVVAFFELNPRNA